jgi:hypothetical protein
MPNGTPGDDPILDIATHRLRVFSGPADRLVRQLLVLMNSQEIEQLRRDLSAVPAKDAQAVSRLESHLEQWKINLIARAASSGWDMDVLAARLKKEEE